MLVQQIINKCWKLIHSRIIQCSFIVSDLYAKINYCIRKNILKESLYIIFRFTTKILDFR